MRLFDAALAMQRHREEVAKKVASLPFEEMTPKRIESYKASLSKEFGSPLGMYIKHEVGVRCSQCGFTTHEGYQYHGFGEVCFRCGVVLTMRGMLRALDNALAANELDRISLHRIIREIDEEITGRMWLLEGRGSYEWDDDRYKLEFGWAVHALQEKLEPLRKIAGDLTNSPTKQEDVDVIKRLESELRMVDEALARRPAVADAPNRYAAICRAFAEAGKVHLELQLKQQQSQRISTAFDLIARANTVTILSLGEMESIVNRALLGEFDAKERKCVRCGSSLNANGQCIHRAEGCQGGWGESQGTNGEGL